MLLFCSLFTAFTLSYSLIFVNILTPYLSLSLCNPYVRLSPFLCLFVSSSFIFSVFLYLPVCLPRSVSLFRPYLRLLLYLSVLLSPLSLFLSLCSILPLSSRVFRWWLVSVSSLLFTLWLWSVNTTPPTQWQIFSLLYLVIDKPRFLIVHVLPYFVIRPTNIVKWILRGMEVGVHSNLQCI